MPNDDMKIITVMTRKGGAGKTTLTRALVSAAMAQGKRCLVIDADPQQALHRWATKLQIDDPLFTIESLTDPAALGPRVDQEWEDGGTDYIFVDTFGAAGSWADDLAAASDVLIVPMMLSDDDMEITTDTYNWYVGLGKRADDPSALPSFNVILSAVPTKQNKTESEVEMDALRKFPVMEDYFMLRKQHRDASRIGFLHTIVDQKRNSEKPLQRIHARFFSEALDEATSILNDLTKVA